jgi:16S rRNA (guanine527-N7)-methyltransferase
LELCLPLVRPGGRLIVWTGLIDAMSLRGVAAELGGGPPLSVATGPGRALLVVEKLEHTPERFPRRPGMAGKRPLPSLPSGA